MGQKPIEGSNPSLSANFVLPRRPNQISQMSVEARAIFHNPGRSRQLDEFRPGFLFWPGASWIIGTGFTFENFSVK
jgi:hypothetical protein